MKINYSRQFERFRDGNYSLFDCPGVLDRLVVQMKSAHYWVKTFKFWAEIIIGSYRGVF